MTNNGTAPAIAIEQLNELEAMAYEAEGEPSDIRWEQARLVAELNDEGISTRAIAAEWLNAETGEAYTKTHVAYAAKAWRMFGNLSCQDRPRWNTAYNSPEVRGKGAHVANNTGNNEWYTPKEYIDGARYVMGGIDLDPASSARANEIVGATTYYTAADDGLKRPWFGCVWMNPPYARELVDAFAARLVTCLTEGAVDQACVLVNNATDTHWFQSMLGICTAVCFLRGRVRFLDPDGNPTGAPLQGQAILYFGPNQDRFRSVFYPFGAVLVHA